jgi:hypothetical protein
MIVRIEVSQPTSSTPYWQLKRCQVQHGGTIVDVTEPTLLRPIRFDGLEDAIRHAKKATFTYLEAKRHTKMPDQIDWRIINEARVFPCPACHQPLYQKAKLGRFGNTLDLQDWGCSRCRKTVTLNTEGLQSTMHQGMSHETAKKQAEPSAKIIEELSDSISEA